MHTPRELIRSVRTLVTLPDIYVRCRTLMDDPNSSMTALGRLIASDPGLSARLLKIANSAFFGIGARVETVTRAVTLLGTQQIHDLVLATSVARAFSGIPYELVNMTAFWWNSMLCAVSARLLAARCDVLDTERLFVAGMLRDVGHLVMYQSIPEAAREALCRAQRTDAPLYQVERELFGFDYAQVGAELLREWRLPESLVEGVELHPEPRAAHAFRLEASILHLASILSDREAGEAALGTPPPVDPLALALTGISEEGLEGLREETTRFAIETVDLIIPASSGRVPKPA